MIASATVAHQVRTAGAFGVQAGAPTVDLAAVVDRKDQVVAGIRSGFERAVAKADGLDFYHAQARFVGPRRLRVGDGETGLELEAWSLFQFLVTVRWYEGLVVCGGRQVRAMPSPRPNWCLDRESGSVVRINAAHLQQLQAQVADLGEQAVQGRLVSDRPGDGGLAGRVAGHL
jgi:hypothetical protein